MKCLLRKIGRVHPRAGLQSYHFKSQSVGYRYYIRKIIPISVSTSKTLLYYYLLTINILIQYIYENDHQNPTEHGSLRRFHYWIHR